MHCNDATICISLWMRGFKHSSPNSQRQGGERSMNSIKIKKDSAKFCIILPFIIWQSSLYYYVRPVHCDCHYNIVTQNKCSYRKIVTHYFITSHCSSWPWAIDCAGYSAQRWLSQSPWWADLLPFWGRITVVQWDLFGSWYTTGSVQDLWLQMMSLTFFFFTGVTFVFLFSQTKFCLILLPPLNNFTEKKQKTF